MGEANIEGAHSKFPQTNTRTQQNVFKTLQAIFLVAEQGGTL